MPRPPTPPPLPTQVLLPALAAHPRLARLNLAGCALTDTGAQALADLLRAQGGRREAAAAAAAWEASLRGSSGGSKDAAWLAGAAGGSRLTELDLSANVVTDAGALLLAGALQGSPAGLRALSLRANHLSVASREAFVAAMKRWPELREVDLRDNAASGTAGSAAGDTAAAVAAAGRPRAWGGGSGAGGRGHRPLQQAPIPAGCMGVLRAASRRSMPARGASQDAPQQQPGSQPLEAPPVAPIIISSSSTSIRSVGAGIQGAAAAGSCGIEQAEEKHGGYGLGLPATAPMQAEAAPCQPHGSASWDAPPTGGLDTIPTCTQRSSRGCISSGLPALISTVPGKLLASMPTHSGRSSSNSRDVSAKDTDLLGQLCANTDHTAAAGACCAGLTYNSSGCAAQHPRPGSRGQQMHTACLPGAGKLSSKAVQVKAAWKPGGAAAPKKQGQQQQRRRSSPPASRSLREGLVQLCGQLQQTQHLAESLAAVGKMAGGQAEALACVEQVGVCACVCAGTHALGQGGVIGLGWQDFLL